MSHRIIEDNARLEKEYKEHDEETQLTLEELQGIRRTLVKLEGMYSKRLYAYGDSWQVEASRNLRKMIINLTSSIEFKLGYVPVKHENHKVI